LGSTPRITITTHLAKDGKTIWYLGGQIAEEGVVLSSAEQIQVTQKEINHLFPWLDFSRARYASFMIDRAENKEPNGRRPDSCFVKEMGNMLVAWPTKLALVPKLAAEIIEKLKIEPGKRDTRALRAWPIPALTAPIWDILLPPEA
jgi:hypothetical protein